MTNFQTGRDVRDLPEYKQALINESKVLQTKFEENQIHVFDVEIDLRGKPSFIHTYMCGEDNEETIVLLHGYSGSSLSYYQMLQPLSQRFKVFALDFIGMGLSDRQNFEIDNSCPQNVIDFFVESVEQWRITLGIEKFVLAGHSFGGYMAANYALKHPEVVCKQLFLFSPMGGTEVTPENDLSNEANFNNYLKSKPFLQKLDLLFSRYQGKKKMTPKKFFEQWFIPKSFVLGQAVQQKLNVKQKDEVHPWIQYLLNFFSLPESTDKQIHSLVGFPRAQPKLSLEEIIRNNNQSMNAKVHALYGDNDWMNSEGCLRLYQQKYLKGTFSTVQSAGHHLIMQQPDLIVKFIINNSNSV
ncbi:alpha/beta fold hydrolase (macronuclear) [Tetrahymena thermophila SB210]|uniref:Alpha/beta fold hydrolase n=1 Tax=Tetrahymena thermophila (strain SB210) TaxID=312017 RepID=Q230X2_TETTS|nr:alpha/beta fold hydrolase [Tetrahymena thermophila SB210]EAR91167.1 alpha/beta fold hydrolase [Tetrahymena thermophila SB210]|eukprot:XP_001011412.1 alpha/beta fold hydrolase [Tetrahymena thermophila SB210]